MERFAAIDFETANGKRSSICSIGIAILEDDWVVDSIYTLVRPTPNFYTRWTTAIHGLTGSPDKPGGLSIQLCKSEKKEFYIRYSS